jgi:1-deoxy-D-xylulose-5-phosphate synthase
VALQKLPVVFCLDRAGLVGEDGPTHHGCYDIAYFRCIPHMIVSAPMNEQELRNLMYTAQLPETNFPFTIRYPRGEGVMVDWKKPFEKIEIGKGRKLKDGKDIAILSFGHPGNFAQTAIRNLRNENIDPAHYDIRFVKPLDTDLLHEVFQNYSMIVTVEDASIVGGFGSAILEFMNEHQYKANVKVLGIPDTIIEHGTLKELQHECHYDANAIADAVKDLLGKKIVAEV